MGSEALSRPFSGFVIFIYIITSIVTVIFAAGSLVLDKSLYSTIHDNICGPPGSCPSFVYALPAIATVFSLFTLILALFQARLYHTRAITGIVYLIVNSFSAFLWLIIIGIGWSPMNGSYDYDTGSYNISSVTGWFLWTEYFYNKHQANYAAGRLSDQLTTDTISISLGLLVMTHIIFSLSFIMAVIGFIVYMQDTSNRRRIGSWAGSTTGNTSKDPSAASMEKESMASV